MIFDIRKTGLLFGFLLTTIFTFANVFEMHATFEEKVNSTTEASSMMIPCDPEIFLAESIDLQTVGSATSAEFCIPVPAAQNLNYQYIINGEIFSGALVGCDIDTIFVYTYATLVGQGNSGPYSIDSWEINGVNITGTFNDIPDLVSFMNSNDPGGNWVDEPGTFSIAGGNSNNTYSSMNATVISIGATTIMNLNLVSEVQGTSIDLSVGTHQVIAVDFLSACTDTVEVNVLNSTNPLDTFNHIAGEIMMAPNTIENGVVYLIQFDPVDSTLTEIDMDTFGTNANGSNYSFYGLAPGNYLVKAALSEGSPSYDSYLPTYHLDKLFWNEATEISIPYVGTTSHNIQMVAGNNPGGPGFIGGLVTEGANLTGSDIEARDAGDPVPNVSVLLLDMDDNAIGYRYTDAEGEYDFDDLAYGTYKVYVEIVGKDPGMQIVTISGENPEVKDVDFNVNTTYSVTSVDEINAIASFDLFPNPLNENGLLNVALEMKTFETLAIEIIHVNGQTLLSSTHQVVPGNNNLQLNLNSLNVGVYFLNVKTSKGVMTRKFVK